MADAVIDVSRGGVVESRHHVHVAVAHADRGLVAAAGDPASISFVRSAIKMFQALPLVEDGGLRRFALDERELALCTASHNGEPFHVEAAYSILRKAGLRESALACGPHPPLHAEAAQALAAAGERPRAIHNNCSGKHAGMLALAVLHGWPVDGYHLPSHPVQQRVVATMAHWADVPVDTLRVGVDGCGLPTFALPLERVAGACARFAAACSETGHAATAIAGAMRRHPEYVAGTGRLCTDLIRSATTPLIAKFGAEGYYCAMVPVRRLGVAIKAEDGATRAVETAILAVLRSLDVLTDADMSRLEPYARPLVRNSRGDIVGEVRARVALARISRA
jgi:L-asparaginase II